MTIEEKLEWDVRYVETVSLLTDLGILWRTFRGLFRREGIYEVRYSENKERRSEPPEAPGERTGPGEGAEERA